MKKLITYCIAASALSLLSGCATIVGSDTQSIAISSTPSQANIRIVDEAGAVAFEGVTPTTADLAKSTGHFFGGKTYTVTVSKDGFAPQVIDITHRATGWYKFGNIFPAGPIGYFAVDPFHGGMYELIPGTIDVGLNPVQKTGAN
jgi:hypothetical protein